MNTVHNAITEPVRRVIDRSTPGTGLGTSSGTAAGDPLDEVGAGYLKGLGDRLHGVSSGSGERDSKVFFLPVQDPAPLSRSRLRLCPCYRSRYCLPRFARNYLLPRVFDAKRAHFSPLVVDPM
jgi:hypothetical protein